MGGREVLIKVVAQATSTYAMIVFKVPSMLCYELQSLIARFWWGGSCKDRKVHWVRWETLCREKHEGGMGFRDLSTFNKALVAKQGWRIFTQPNSLMVHVLKAKYFSHVNYFYANIGITPLIHGRVLFGIVSFLKWGRGGRLEMMKMLEFLKILDFINYIGECRVVREGMFLANWCGCKKFVVESDASNVIKTIQKPMCQVLEPNIVDNIRDLIE